jgi:hypothetical protein
MVPFVFWIRIVAWIKIVVVTDAFRATHIPCVIMTIFLATRM